MLDGADVTVIIVEPIDACEEFIVGQSEGIGIPLLVIPVPEAIGIIWSGNERPFIRATDFDLKEAECPTTGAVSADVSDFGQLDLVGD